MRGRGAHAVEGGRVFQSREIARITALGERLYGASEHLAAPCFRQRLHEVHAFRTRDSPDLLIHDVLYGSLQLRTSLLGLYFIAILRDDVGEHGLSLFLVLHADGGSFGDLGVIAHGLLDLTCPQPVARDVYNVVRASHDEVVTVLVLHAPVEGRVQRLARKVREIRLDEPLVVAPHGAHETWRERRLYGQDAALVGLRFLATLLVH